MSAPKREHLLDTAERLFAAEGFKGVSVDRLIAEAGVAKMTLYKGFATKTDLIRATLERRGDRLAAHIEAEAARHEAQEEKLLSAFDAMESWAARDDFNGCYFLNAIGEFGTASAPEAAIARRYKAGFLAQLTHRCHHCGVDQPDRLALDLFMLIDGATAAWLTLGNRQSFARAKNVARRLLDIADRT